ncbi:MAG: OmpA family protein [Brachymonas sp.]|nr:OmpA family protein [Brachymonas sp.]
MRRVAVMSALARCARGWQGKCWALGLVAGLGIHAAQAQSLSAVPAHPRRDSHLRPVQQASSLSRAAADSSLQAAGNPATKLEQVQQLKQSLQARETPQEIVIDLPSDVLFDFDKSTLRAEALPVLAKAAQLIAAYPQAPVCINGHTDSKGSHAYNQALSLRRAQAVATQLSRVLPARNLQMRGFGEERPVAANTQPDGSDHPEGRQRNRRVEIVIGTLSSEAAAATAGASCTAPVAP